ncbi:YbaB/EbfC family nucleoid-associated protein [Novosphingobium umbonatum]|uniref:Nucleoid-associated protein EOE18_17145 n=1 Tax=Novosphingobium umbonatum TaxID=1908524 RepID=A0A3S2Y573_9SPHN|nr:YbaB/EbfC family nucleoid-associated protein [Novosphingobium umbonatum]RVU02343.1 YbaB/EbfC family nucleoid-associated protein [Novosphingobium umbonatum]
MKSMEEMIKAAQAAAETISKQMNETQAKLDALEVKGVSGGGLVQIRASAKGRVIGVEIDESLLTPAEKGVLEDLIAAAFNDARAKADEVAGAEMAKAQCGLGLPPGFKLPF